jgi:hypothetical protein
MTDQDLQDLLSKYPLLLKGVSSIDCQSGWYQLIDVLCGILTDYIADMPEELQPDLYSVRVKEKFGGLRVYMNESTDYIRGAISIVENLSFRTCEVCGQAGETRPNLHVQTLCSKHYKRSLK